MRNLLVDWSVNRGDLRIQLALLLFRLARATRTSERIPALVARAICLGYLVVVEWTWGIELPWQTRVGPRLRIYHGTGVVVHAESVLGSDVILRQGVCIGERSPRGGTPRIEDGVELGANSMVLGACTVGPGATIAAGAIVTTDVPAGHTAVGPRSRLLPPRQ